MCSLILQAELELGKRTPSPKTLDPKALLKETHNGSTNGHVNGITNGYGRNGIANGVSNGVVNGAFVNGHTVW